MFLYSLLTDEGHDMETNRFEKCASELSEFLGELLSIEELNSRPLSDVELDTATCILDGAVQLIQIVAGPGKLNIGALDTMCARRRAARALHEFNDQCSEKWLDQCISDAMLAASVPTGHA
jgi:hypothetical protein